MPPNHQLSTNRLELEARRLDADEAELREGFGPEAVGLDLRLVQLELDAQVLLRQGLQEVAVGELAAVGAFDRRASGDSRFARTGAGFRSRCNRERWLSWVGWWLVIGGW